MRQLGTNSQSSNLEIEEENFTVILDYDWQSQRVMVQLKFIYEGCCHATIKYKGTELHNGDFDIIVLNSKLCLISYKSNCSCCIFPFRCRFHFGSQKRGI